MRSSCYYLVLRLLGVLFVANALLAGELQVNIINGTKNETARVDRIALLDLSNGMVEVASMTDISGSTTFYNLNPDRENQFLIQTNAAGIAYSKMLSLPPDSGRWETSVVIYDVSSDQPEEIYASMPFYVIYAFESKLYIQKRLVLENHSNPPISYINSQGLIHVFIPGNITQMDYMTVKNGQLPLRTEVLETESGQVIPDPLKPGISEIDMAYYLPYQEGKAEIIEKIAYNLDHFPIYVMPLDIHISADGLKRVGTDKDNGLAIYALENVKSGTDINFKISGKGMSEAESEENSNMGRIVVEHRLPLGNKLIIAGIFIVLILLVLFISIFRHYTNMKGDSINLLNAQKNVLLLEYSKLLDSSVRVSERDRILHQLISVYITMDRMR